MRWRWWLIGGIVLVLVCGPLAAGGRAIASDPAHVAANTRGTAYGWGDPRYNKLGTAEIQHPTPAAPYPVALGGGAEIVSVSAGGLASFFLRADGGVAAVGGNDHGILGTGESPQFGYSVPQPVAGVGGAGTIGGVVAISAGWLHTLALLDTGAVVAWGNNQASQLGDGTVAERNTPTYVSDPAGTGPLTAIKAVAAGCQHSLALGVDGRVYAWGDNTDGQLGDGRAERRAPRPVRVLGPDGTTPLSGIRAIAAGCYHSLALADDNTVYSFGGASALPARVPAPGGAAGSSLGEVGPIAAIGGGAAHSVALTANGAVYTWGEDQYGQLGDDDALLEHPYPVQVAGSAGGTLSGITAIAVGYQFTLALTGAGTVYSWGDNYYGQLGTGARGGVRGVPGLVLAAPSTPLTGVRALGAGPLAYHGLGTVAVPPTPTPSPAPPLAPGQTFADVPPGYWAYDQIGAVATRGITTGCADDALGRRLYCPERGVTRAEMATFLTRALGQDQQAPPATPTFADVPTDYWAYQQIEAFATLGITTGCGTNDRGQRVFCPDRGVTRAEMAAFLDRARGQSELANPTPTFADVPPGYWAYGWIERAFTLALTTGCGDDDQGRTVYCPDRGVTRAEMAVFILRAYP